MFATDREITRIGLGLLDLSLPKDEWTHGAHFAAALWLLRCRPEISPSAAMPGFIRSYNQATGGQNTDSAGYHETITQASLRATRAFLDQWAAEEPLHRIHRNLMASPLGKPDWLMEYWTRQSLFSVQARRAWVAPDLKALPF